MKNLILLYILLLSGFAFAQENGEDREVKESIELKGDVDGFNIRNFDDKIDFGLVIPTLSKEQILDFNISYVLSSKIAVVRAAGQKIEVPSNISLPNQSERYFITVRLNKPNFELPVTTASTPEDIVVLEGRFPFESTVNALRSGRPISSVINSFSYSSYSLFSVMDSNAPLKLSVGNSPIDGAAKIFESPFEEDIEFVTLGLNLASLTKEDGTLKHFPVDVRTLERPVELFTDALSDNTPVVVAIPKNVFTSTADAGKKPFPFTMVWGEAAPFTTLPLAKDFMSRSNGSLFLSPEKLDAFSVLAHNITYLDENKNVISSTLSFDPLPTEIALENLENASRIRFDVYAADPDPILSSVMLSNFPFGNDDLFSRTKYVTRYEENLN